MRLNLRCCRLVVILTILASGQQASTNPPIFLEGHGANENPAPGTVAGNGRLERFVPLTTSTINAFPEGPPPYQVQRLYPEMKMPYAQITYLIPGTNELLVITSPGAGSSTKIHRMKDEPNVKTWDLWFDSADVVYQMAFHPRWAENGYVYIGSNGAGPSPTTPLPKEGKKHEEMAKKKSRITRYTMQTMSPFRITPGSEKTILDVPSDGHNGAAVAFGHDGMLYVTTGDGTSDSDTNVVGQDMSTLLAKVLRIDVDHPASGKSYSVPKDNPFLTHPGARSEIWALGLRNPWRMCVDQKTGHLWVGQNGQDLWEQAFLVKKGDNFGWSVMEGSHPFYLERKLAPVPLTKPTVEHPHSESRSLTGGLVYYGKKFPELVGYYIYGDYSTGKIWAVKHDGAKVLAHKEIADTRLSITGFGTDSKGEILIADFHRGDTAGLYTLVPTPFEKGTRPFPKRLSETGLFESVPGHVMKDSMIPYSVNAVLWSDGAAKQRWLGLPKKGTIEYRKSRGWGFPDQTVIVKSFHVDRVEGDPTSRRWIETRILTRQGDQWYGFSYAWNDEQSEGTLVESRGSDRAYSIQSAAGNKKLNWHYPSRSECMVCHSRAAHYVLGFSELQMNRTHEYGTSRENQIEAFARLDLFKKFDWSSAAHEQMRKDLKNRGRTTKEINEEIARRMEAAKARDPRTGPQSSLLPFALEKAPRLVDPYDKTQDLSARVRSYLHSNCAQCHVESGGGNSAMELEFTKTIEEMKVVDVKPVHDSYGIKDAKLVAPGHPERSILLHRIAHRDKGHMPPLATRVVDREMVEAVREWIRTMKKD
jgi:glucose/arabinose dehydrogenase